MDNIFKNLPGDKSEEIFEDIIVKSGFKLERIVSNGQSTAEGQWYDQKRDEWIVLLSGAAELLFEGDSETLKMTPGDYILIPAGKKHRVVSTDSTKTSVWIALHYDA